MTRIPVSRPPIPTLSRGPGRRPVFLAIVAGGVLASAVLPVPVRGQERSPAPTIAPDRPGIGDGAWVVAPGVFQLEAGASVRGGEGPRLYSLGQAVLRIGAGAAEVRVHLNSLVIQRNGVDDEGFEDPALGAKIPLASGETARLSGLAALSLPIGSDRFGSGDATASVAGLLDWSGGGSLAVSSNLGVDGLFADGGTRIFASLTPGLSPDGVPGLGLYGGWAGSFFEGGADRHWVEGGVTYLLADDTQIDLNGGWDPEGDTGFLGLGVARRVR